MFFIDFWYLEIYISNMISILIIIKFLLFITRVFSVFVYGEKIFTKVVTIII